MTPKELLKELLLAGAFGMTDTLLTELYGDTWIEAMLTLQRAGSVHLRNVSGAVRYYASTQLGRVGA